MNLGILYNDICIYDKRHNERESQGCGAGWVVKSTNIIIFYYLENNYIKN